MRINKGRGAIVMCSIAVAAVSSSAFARPVHHHHHHKAHHLHIVAHRAASTALSSQTAAYAANATALSGTDREPRYSNLSRQRVATDTSRRRHGRRPVQVASTAASTGGATSNSLVADARRYIGTNPTGRRSLWCGAFMDLVLRETGHKGGGNLALGYLHYGTRVSGPQVGAIAVMGRRGGGHVGVVSGVDPNGNPIIISGNHNHTTAEAVYPRRRIAAYVVPNS